MVTWTACLSNLRLEQLIGAIQLKDCHFDRCTFQGIGFLDKNRELRAHIANG